jgi:hypothetical protein
MAEVEYVGPFKEWEVVVDGRRVPHVTAVPLSGGKVRLVLDNRFGLVLDVAMANKVVPFLADAIAVAMGYTCHPRPRHKRPRKRIPFPRMHSVVAAETE